jgi:HSP20 family protein
LNCSGHALLMDTYSDLCRIVCEIAKGHSRPLTFFSRATRVLAIIELPGIDKNDLQIQAKENTIRISGKKVVNYPESSVHRRERVFGEFDRRLSLPVQIDPDGIKA